MAHIVDCASRMPANRETEMTHLQRNSIQERSTGTTGFAAQAANLPPYDPLRS